MFDIIYVDIMEKIMFTFFMHTGVQRRYVSRADGHPAREQGKNAERCRNERSFEGDRPCTIF